MWIHITDVLTSIVLAGDALKKLEERGVVIRFVIGRRFLHTLILISYHITDI